MRLGIIVYELPLILTALLHIDPINVVYSYLYQVKILHFMNDADDVT